MRLEASETREIVNQAVFAVTMFVAGAFIGVEIVTRHALATTPFFDTPIWIDSIEPLRFALFGCVVVGFTGLLALDYWWSETA